MTMTHDRTRRMTSDWWRGLDTDQADADDVALPRYYARARAFHRLRGEHNDLEVLLPGFTQADLRYSGAAPEGRDLKRRRVILDDIDDEHDDRHWFFKHPFCQVCYDEMDAELRLNRWMILNPGRTPRDTWDGVAPEDDKPAPTTAESLTWLTLNDLAEMPPARMMIEDVLPMGALVYITGRDSSFKTFLALDFVLSVATLREGWMGRTIPTLSGCHRTMYLAGEGVRDFPKRVAAWAAHHGVTLEPYMLENLAVRNGTVDLFGAGADFADLLERVRRDQPDLIVVDTLNRSAGQAEQNSASDMSVITARLAEVKHAAGPNSTLIVLAHTDKGDNDARGSSSIEDDADAVLHCKKTSDLGLRVKVAKLKDGASGQSYDFAMTKVTTDLGESLVITEPGEEPKWLSDDLGARVRGVLVAAHGHDPLSFAQVQTAVKQDGTGKPVSPSGIRKALSALEAAGEIESEKVGNGLTAPRKYWAAEHIAKEA